MRMRLLGKLLSGLAVAIAPIAAIALPSQAQRNQFYCGTSKGVPATIVRTPRGNLPVIRWTSNVFPPPYTPQQRCEIVSQRFQEFQNNGRLKYITTGIENNQLVVCIANRRDGDCTGLLFTLKPESDPRQTLERLLNYQALVAGGALNESSGERLYIDMEEFINKAPIEESSESSDTPWLAN